MNIRKNAIVPAAILAAIVLSACGGAAAPAPAPAQEPAPAATATSAPEPTQAPAAPEGVQLPAVDPLALDGKIIAAGSSTVGPLTQRVAEIFTDEGFKGELTNDVIGTGAGFERFCKGETDISNASRAIKSGETDTCQAAGIEPIEFRVGTDALAVVVSKDNTWLTGLTKLQLAGIFSGTYQTWDQVDPSYPAEKIQLFSPGTDSGTFDYFVEAVLGNNKELILNANPQLSENDNVLVQGVEGSPNAIGYFGYAYYAGEGGKLRALPIDGVEPNDQTAESGEYPLSRPLFIYSTAKIMKDKPQVAGFINFYLTRVNDAMQDVKYFPASAEAINQARQNWLDAMK
jgi:phosphate binding protein